MLEKGTETRPSDLLWLDFSNTSANASTYSIDRQMYFVLEAFLCAGPPSEGVILRDLGADCKSEYLSKC